MSTCYNGFAIGTLPANDPKAPHAKWKPSPMDTALILMQKVLVSRSTMVELSTWSDSGFKLRSFWLQESWKYHGQTLICDGTTLLGADDKSVLQIMTAIEYLTAHPEIKHCEIHWFWTWRKSVSVLIGFDADDTMLTLPTLLMVDL